MAADLSKLSRNSAFDALFCRISALKLGYFQQEKAPSTLEDVGPLDTSATGDASNLSAAMRNWPTRRPKKPQAEVDDPYTCHMFSRVVKRPIDTVPRKPPIINRGTYARHYVINTFIKRFLDACIENDGLPCQIVYLGAGYDASAMRIIRDYSTCPLTIFEVDVDETIFSKETIVRSYLESTQSPKSELERIKASIKFIGHDLNDPAGLISVLLSQDFIPTAPTLFISECVLVYLEELNTINLISAFRDLCPNAAWLSYDMINPHDPFGKTMLANITSTGER